MATGVTRDQLRLEALLGSGKARAAALWLIKEGTKMGLNCNYGGVVFFRHAANDVQHDPLAYTLVVIGRCNYSPRNYM